MKKRDILDVLEDRLDKIIVKEKEILEEYSGLKREIWQIRIENITALKTVEEPQLQTPVAELKKEAVQEEKPQIQQEKPQIQQATQVKQAPQVIESPRISQVPETKISNSEEKATGATGEIADSSKSYIKDPLKTQNPHVQNPAYTGRPYAQSLSSPTPVQAPIYRQPIPKRKDTTGSTENMFGKNIMGIVASLLIFIGLVSLAILIYDKIPDILRMAMMFVISGGLALTGLTLGQKNKNAFSISLLGCGIGGLYISIIATNVIFHYTSSIAVYVLLFLWVLIILYIADKFEYGNFFRLICQIGIMISLVLSWVAGLSLFEYVLISVYTVISFAIIEKNGKIWNFINSIGYLIISITFACLACVPSILNPEMNAEQILWMRFLNLVFFGGFHIFAVQKIKKNECEHHLFHIGNIFSITLIYLITIPIALWNLYEMNPILYFVIYIALILLVNAREIIAKNIETLQVTILIPSLLVLSLIMPMFIISEFQINYMGYSLLYIPMLTLGFKQRKQFYQITGFILLYVDIILLWCLRLFMKNQTDTQIFIENLLLIIVIVAVLLSLAYMVYHFYKEKRDIVTISNKILIYITANLILLVLFPLIQLDHTMVYSKIICMVLTYLAIASGYFFRWDEAFRFFPEDRTYYRKEDTGIMTALLWLGNIIFMYSIITLTFRNLRLDLHIAFALISALYTIFDTKDLYQEYKDSSYLGPFIGIKITIFVFAFIYSVFDIMKYPYLVSIVLILIACICIYIGFAKKFTSFRIYGLVITLASVLKLVTYDIQGFNSIIRVLAFIVGGLLCFVINLLYNNASKKVE